MHSCTNFLVVFTKPCDGKYNRLLSIIFAFFDIWSYFRSRINLYQNMPSELTINIYFPKKKLILFAEAVYGSQPLIIPKKDNLNRLINMLLKPPPTSWRVEHYGQKNLAVQLPYYDDKNVKVHYYLSARAQTTVSNRFDDLFNLEFRRHVDKMLLLGVMNQLDAIYSFMEAYDLPEDVISDLLKDYQRYRTMLRVRAHRKRLEASHL